MKKIIVTVMFCFVSFLLSADTKITWLADVTADRAETVTGVQSGQVANAVAHINRTDNPHSVTAAQIGALTDELDPVANAALVVHTNRIDNPHGVTAAQIGAITAELDPVAVVHTNRTDNPHSVTAQQIGAIVVELDPVANAALAVHTNRVDNPHSVTAAQIGAITAELDPVAGPRLDLIEPATNKWNAAYSWGDHALAGYLLPAALAPYATTAALVVHTNRNDNPHNVTAVQIGAITAESDPAANAALTVHTNRVDNPHGVTAQQIGALTGELDLAALRAFHYGSPDIVESPAEWFVFDGAGTITAFNWAAGRENVVIPWAIGGVPVTAIGANAFVLSGIVSLIAPQTVTLIENSAFYGCGSLASVSLPQVQTIWNEAFYSCFSLASVSLPQVETIGDNAFYYCISLASVYFGNNAPTIGYEIFENITPNQVTIYVTNPTATGWSATLGGMPVVRLSLYADAITLNGDTITEWPVGGEQDLSAMRTYHYGSTNIIESPSDWFVTDGMGTITNFNYTDDRKNVIIPWNIGGVQITNIGANAFSPLFVGYAITNIIFPKSVESVGPAAFYNSSSLVSAIMPSVKILGVQAFRISTKLNFIFAPEVTLIGSACLESTKIKVANFPNATSVGDHAFFNCSLLSTVNIPNVLTVGNNGFRSCGNITSLSLPNLRWAGTYAFEGTSKLSTFKAPQLETILDYCFNGCAALTEIYLPNLINSGRSFTECSKLVTADFPNLKTIGNSGFANCTKLSILRVPLLETIGDTCFYYCTSLTSLELPSIKYIAAEAFRKCDNLNSIYYSYRSAPRLGADIFMGIPEGRVTNYVVNASSIGWTSELAGRPVVRLPLYADAIYQAGELVATEAHVAQAIAAPYTAWTGTITPVNGTATVTIAHGNMPVLVTDAPCVLTLDPTGYGTAGVSRVSLSYYPGANSFTFATDVIQYAETPTVDTSGWNTLLIRRVSNGAWKGVGL